jgi:hypothetical protein
MSCTFQYVEKALREKNPEEADRLNEKGIETWKAIKNSKLFTLNKNKQYNFSKEGTKQKIRQDEFIDSINENEFISNNNNEINVNLLKLSENKNRDFASKKNFSEFVDDTLEMKDMLLKGVNFIEEKVNSFKKDYTHEHERIIFGGKEENLTIDEILENILKNFNDLSPIGKELIQKSRRLFGKTGARFKFVSDEDMKNLDTLMQIKNKTNTIEISKNRIKNHSPREIIKSILHEISHAQSIQAIKNPVTFEEREFSSLIKSQFNKYFNKQVDKSVRKTGGYSKENQSYGFENELEFIAEIYSNPDFRQELKDLDSEHETSFWINFINSFRRLIGMAKSKEANNLIESIIDFVEADRRNYVGVDVSDNLISEQKIDNKNIELDTIAKQLQHTIDQTIDRITQLITRTKSSINTKNKEEKDKFIKGFEDLLNEIKNLEKNNQWKAITLYTKSFSGAVNNLNNNLRKSFRTASVVHNNITYSFSENEMFKPTGDSQKYVIAEDLYEKYKDFDSVKQLVEKNLLDINDDLYDILDNKSNKDIGTQEMLETVNAYDEYLSAYDLLDEINSLIKRSQNDSTLDRKGKIQIEEIKNVLNGLEKNHKTLVAGFLNVKKAYAINLFAKPENNTKIVNIWKNKIYAEYAKLGIKSETKEAYFGRMISTKYKEAYNNALLEDASKVIYDPYFDISSMVSKASDLLNINSPLINLMSNIVGKIRDSIITAYHDKQFEMSKIFDKYSKKYGQNSQSKMFGNIVQLSKNGTYYLKSEYTTDFLDSVENELYPILNEIKEAIASHEGFFGNQKELRKQLREDDEYQVLRKKRAAWFKEHTIIINNSTQPKIKYRNKELSKEELELLNYFKSETEKNNKESYDGKMSLIRKTYGAVYYKLPSVTKSDLERTLEGDVKGQFKDKWTDLTNTKADDINYGKAIGENNKEKNVIKIGYRSRVEAKEQSLDLFTVYRKEALNAINYREKKSKENQLKLFVDIAKDKDYKQRSKSTGKWLQNKYAENSLGETFSGEHSNELKKIEDLLETHLYDILSYSGEKIFGTNIEAAKAASMVNGFAASIAMTANLGSGVVNVANGVTQMFMEAVGGEYFNRENLRKAEYNYGKNLMSILEDLNQPVKKSFHNQMLDMFDIFGGFDTATQEFIRNSYAKKIISTHSMNGLNEMGEHMMNSILTEAILRDIKVMNKSRQFIDKDGNVVDEKKSASLFDMLSLNTDGKLVMSDKVVYTKKNLDTEYHKGGKTHINYLIKKKGHDIFGVYDPLMKASIAKTWWGKTIMMFKNFFLSGLEYRYKGVSSSLKSKDELTDDDISFNNAQQEFTEGIYTSFTRFFVNGVIPALKNLSISYMKDNYNSLSDYEKSNLNKTTLEIGLTMVILPLVGYILALAKTGDDDDKLFFALYVFRRLESELSQFRDPRELNRMIQNPVAANRFIQNALTSVSDIISPLNFAPKNNEVFFDYLSEDAKHKNIIVKHLKKTFPLTAQMDKEYQKLYNLIDK